MAVEVNLIERHPDGRDSDPDRVMAAFLPPPKTEDGMSWEQRAKELWGLLDDISTLGDQHKPEETGYVKAGGRACEKRGQYLVSPDGHTLVKTED